MITNQITSWRTQRGITKAHLARHVGVSRSYVTRLEQGRVQPSGRVMFRVAAYFRTEIEEIFQFCPERCQLGNGHGVSSDLPAGLAGSGETKGKAPVSPAAKVVAQPIACGSQTRK